MHFRYSATDRNWPWDRVLREVSALRRMIGSNTENSAICRKDIVSDVRLDLHRSKLCWNPVEQLHARDGVLHRAKAGVIGEAIQVFVWHWRWHRGHGTSRFTSHSPASRLRNPVGVGSDGGAELRQQLRCVGQIVEMNDFHRAVHVAVRDADEPGRDTFACNLNGVGISAGGAWCSANLNGNVVCGCG